MACGAVTFPPLSPRMPMAFAPSGFSSSSSSSSFFSAAASPLRIRAASTAALPVPPLNPRDPFLSKLASAAAAAPDPFALASSPDPDSPPYLHLFDSPKLMATPAQVLAEFWNLSFLSATILQTLVFLLSDFFKKRNLFSGFISGLNLHERFGRESKWRTRCAVA